ncbi:unnamed protein product [Rangifer tarandus platyrhynchus]|uniref:Uncharacterized protein n=1 Tax=Rangifer tarandus platyrhynchus TaxID=3082113 RepID=A0AC59Y7H9_RANTA
MRTFHVVSLGSHSAQEMLMFSPGDLPVPRSPPQDHTGLACWRTDRAKPPSRGGQPHHVRPPVCRAAQTARSSSRTWEHRRISAGR